MAHRKALTDRISRERIRELARKQSEQPKDYSLTMQRIVWVCATVLSVLIVYLHVYRAGHAGALWRDEVSTIGTVNFPSHSQLWSALIYESFPLLPYLVVRTWVGLNWLGGSDASLRVLGALIGCGVLLPLWLNKRLLGYRVPMVSLVLFGLNPSAIRWCDSLRGYGLGSVLILLAYGLVWKVVESPTPRMISAAALISILSVQSLYQNAFLLFAICAGAFAVCLRRRSWKTMAGVCGIGAISALSLVPYLPTIADARSVHIVADVSSDFAQLRSMFEMGINSGNSLLCWSWLICGAFAILAAVVLIGFNAKGREAERRSDLAIFCLTNLVLATVVFLLFHIMLRFEPQPWHYLVLTASFALSTDVLLALAATTTKRTVGLIIVSLVVAGITMPTVWKELDERQTNIDLVAATLQDRAATGDLIVVSPWFNGVTFQRYFRGNVSWTTAPPIADVHLTRYDLLKERMMQVNPLGPVFDAMEKTLSAGHRVWVVGNVSAPPRGQVPPSLPPAPNGPRGWYSGDYLVTWILQLGYFVQAHATAGGEIKLEIPQPVSSYENARLWEFSGWHP
jgi:hypothetical protein